MCVVVCLCVCVCVGTTIEIYCVDCMRTCAMRAKILLSVKSFGKEKENERNTTKQQELIKIAVELIIRHTI